jgi:hypothetical protein
MPPSPRAQGDLGGVPRDVAIVTGEEGRLEMVDVRVVAVELTPDIPSSDAGLTDSGPTDVMVASNPAHEPWD